MYFNCWSTRCIVWIYVKSIPGSLFLVTLSAVPECCSFVLTSANDSESQHLLLNTFVPLFWFSVRFVALEAFGVGVASGKGSEHCS